MGYEKSRFPDYKPHAGFLFFIIESRAYHIRIWRGYSGFT
jgi:hypothetical protein